MASSRFDVLNAVDLLVARGDRATSDAVAAELLTTRDDVTPQLVAAVRAALLDTAKGSDGIAAFGLTERGVRELAEGLG